MCGITGFWRPNAERATAETSLRCMMDTLHHRGPDGSGVHVDDERGLFMGHTRLSIIGLDTGAQPLVSQGDRLVLTVNGEFYDYKRIRARLACDGERFQTRSDSEIAIPLYRRYGLDFVHHLRGEFAIAIFDPQKQRLVLVRDRFGVKPLYYRFTGDELFYGSEVKSIVEHPDVPAELDSRAVINQMMQVMVPGTTSYKGVETLQPGHMLIIEKDGDRLRKKTVQYWDFEFPAASEHQREIDPDVCVEGVRDILLDSVVTRLEADVPVGCYLSGGIDSCSILGIATAVQQSHVKAFTISFEHESYDELAIAREMAEETQAEQEVLRLGADELYGESFETVTRHAERTFYNTLAVAKWHMSKRVRECGYKVVVTGEGSDELFGGYPFFKRDLLLHAPEDAGEASGKELDIFRGAILAEERQHHRAWDELCGFTPSWIQPWMMTLSVIRPLLSEKIRDETEGYDPIAAIAETIDPDKVRGRHPLDIAQYTWSKTMLEGQILTWGGDRVDMANSMESRPAFLDHNLAEFAVRVPPNLRIKDGVEKWVLREAMRGVLPEVLYKREKFAFMAPPAHTSETKTSGLQELANKWLPPERVEADGLFDPEAVALFVREQQTDDPMLARRHDIILNHLIQLQILSETAREASAVGA